MRERGPAILLAFLTAIAGAAGAALFTDSYGEGQRVERAEEFQRLVGGLGFGPALDLSRCTFSFDPRLCQECPEDHWPIPGGVYFCPHHGCSILYFPRLGVGTRAEDGEDALVR